MNSLSINFSLFIFRVSIGLFMLLGHGLGKFNKLISGNEIKFLDLWGLGSTLSFYLATFAEFFGSLFVIFGLFTRIGSLSLIITMAVAAFIAHAGDPFGGKEKSLLFLVSFFLIFVQGPGKYSLQQFLDNKLKTSSGLIKSLLK